MQTVLSRERIERMIEAFQLLNGQTWVEGRQDSWFTELRCGDLCLHFDLDDKDRINIMGYLTHELWEHREGTDVPRISVTNQKESLNIVRDINRRVMPALLQAQEIARQNKRKHEERLARSRETAGKIAHLLGGRTRERDSSSFSWEREKIDVFSKLASIEVHPDRVVVERLHVPHEHALRLVNVLASIETAVGADDE